MVKHVWSVICSKSSIDKTTNNVSLFEVLEQIQFKVQGPNVMEAKKKAAESHIVAPFSFEIVSLWYRESVTDGKDVDVKLIVSDPKGTPLQEHSHRFSFGEDKKRVRVDLKINGFPVTRSGIYHMMMFRRVAGEAEFDEPIEIPLQVDVNFEEGNPQV